MTLSARHLCLVSESTQRKVFAGNLSSVEFLFKISSFKVVIGLFIIIVIIIESFHISL